MVKTVFGVRFSVLGLAAIAAIMLRLPATVGAANTWELQAVGGTHSVDVRAMVVTSDRGKVGLTVGWTDALNGDQEAVKAGAVATWDVLSDVNLPFTLPWGTGSGTIKATGYLGAEVDLLTPTHGQAKLEASPAGLVGLRVGDGRTSIWAELRGGLTDQFWENLANTPSSELRVGVGYAWK